jgi:hypothetical protein
MGNKEPEQLLITIQYEKKLGDANLLAKELAGKGHTVSVTKHMELWEADKEVHDGEVVKHE